MVPVETHCLHRNHLTRSDMSALSRKFLSTSLLANPRGTQLGRRRPSSTTAEPRLCAEAGAIERFPNSASITGDDRSWSRSNPAKALCEVRHIHCVSFKSVGAARAPRIEDLG
jgi:hypothetical protein